MLQTPYEDAARTVSKIAMGSMLMTLGIRMIESGYSDVLVVSLFDRNEDELAALRFVDETKGNQFIEDPSNRVLNPQDTSVWRPTFGAGPVRDEFGRLSFMVCAGVQMRFLIATRARRFMRRAAPISKIISLM